jgi:DNA-binding YbaB/EbfC family protein
MDINPFDLLKNAQKIQEQIGEFQNKLSEINVTGSAGGGMVEVDLNGKFEIAAVRIAPEVVESGDTEMLQDLVAAAFTSGLEKVKDAVNGEMGAMAGGLGIPGLGNTGFPPGFPGFS